MRVAAIYDIHGNLPALDAVLAAIEPEGPDLIVVGGDVAAGPLPAATIARLMDLGPRARFVRGNADRELVAAFDGAPPDPRLPPIARAQIAWAAGQLDRAARDFLAGFTPPITLPIDGIGDTLFCHGSPRDEDEIITAITPEERLGRIVAGVGAALVVCGHTHMQFDRRSGATRVVNAGSVGMPYGEPGAYWLMLGPGVALRREDYDLDAAAGRIRAGGFPWADDFAERNLRRPPSADGAAALFEGWADERERGVPRG